MCPSNKGDWSNEVSASVITSVQGCIEADWQCGGSNGKVKIEGYMSVSDGEAHHPLSTEIVTVISHLVTRACWGTEAKAEGGEEDMT